MADSAEQLNELNYMAWKKEHALRRQQLRTQFNVWREKQHDRLCNHHVYKNESTEQTDQLKEMLSERLEKACSCNACRTESTQFRRLSDVGQSEVSRRTSIGDTGGQPLKAGTNTSRPTMS